MVRVLVSLDILEMIVQSFIWASFVPMIALSEDAVSAVNVFVNQDGLVPTVLFELAQEIATITESVPTELATVSQAGQAPSVRPRNVQTAALDMVTAKVASACATLATLVKIVRAIPAPMRAQTTESAITDNVFAIKDLLDKIAHFEAASMIVRDMEHATTVLALATHHGSVSVVMNFHVQETALGVDNVKRFKEFYNVCALKDGPESIALIKYHLENSHRKCLPKPTMLTLSITNTNRSH